MKEKLSSDIKYVDVNSPEFCRLIIFNSTDEGKDLIKEVVNNFEEKDGKEALKYITKFLKILENNRVFKIQGADSGERKEVEDLVSPENIKRVIDSKGNMLEPGEFFDLCFKISAKEEVISSVNKLVFDALKRVHEVSKLEESLDFLGKFNAGSAEFKE